MVEELQVPIHLKMTLMIKEAAAYSVSKTFAFRYVQFLRFVM